MSLVSKLTSSIFGWKAMAIAVAVSTALAGAAGFTLAWKLQGAEIARLELAATKKELRGRQATDKLENKTQGVADKVDRQHAATQAKIETERRYILERVPIYVRPEDDAEYPVPLGFVRLHDAAARGDVSALAGPSGDADRAPSGVALSTVGTVVADNYGTLHACRARVAAWEQFYAGVRAEYLAAAKAAERKE